MITKALDLVLKTVIVLALLNGMVDGLLLAQHWVRSSVADFQSRRHGFVGPAVVDMHLEPGIGKTPVPMSLPGFTIAQDGRRAPRQTDSPPADRRILLLGASQAFGAHVADDLVVSRQLERDHPNWEIMNYAVPGETLINNRIRLSFLAARGIAIDQVLVMASLLEILDRCLPAPQVTDAKYSLALKRLFMAISRRVNNTNDMVTDCAQPERASALAHAIYDEMVAILATADRLNLPVRVILSPTAFNGSLAAEQSFDNALIRAQQDAFRPTYDALRRLIAEGRNPRIIDLSDAIDTVQGAFIDDWSHFSPRGHRAMADRLGPLIKTYGRAGPDRPEATGENEE